MAGADDFGSEVPYQGERTRILRDRDFNCGNFSDYADLRRIDFSWAQFRNADFGSAKLGGVAFVGAQLQGASFNSAELQGASLNVARLQGASLKNARLQGASLNQAELQGVSLDGARLQGASLDHAQLQGASLKNAGLDQAVLVSVRIWGARGVNCVNARVSDPGNDAVIARRPEGDPIPATPDEIEKLITEWVAEIPEERGKEDVRKILRERLTVAKNDTAMLGDVWSHCESESRKVSQEDFDGGHLAVLRRAVCNDRSEGADIGKSIALNWISDNEGRREFSARLARALLGEDGNECAAAKDYHQATKTLLRGAAGPPLATIAPK
ncbi:MAG: hypothetical protein QOJ84_1280 [Bradyrhizobium sp.]|jgi:hypothetical protein|nr:hypothetical protein [Bradyrhizobium sp.]